MEHPWGQAVLFEVSTALDGNKCYFVCAGESWPNRCSTKQAATKLYSPPLDRLCRVGVSTVLHLDNRISSFICQLFVFPANGGPSGGPMAVNLELITGWLHAYPTAGLIEPHAVRLSTLQLQWFRFLPGCEDGCTSCSTRVTERSPDFVATVYIVLPSQWDTLCAACSRLSPCQPAFGFSTEVTSVPGTLFAHSDMMADILCKSLSCYIRGWVRGRTDRACQRQLICPRPPVLRLG